jgi:ATP-binding cassette subfamily B protein
LERIDGWAALPGGLFLVCPAAESFIKIGTSGTVRQSLPQGRGMEVNCVSDIRKLLRFVRPYRKLAAFSLAMLLAMVFLDLAIPRLVERVIDNGIRQKNMSVVLTTSALMLGISLLSTIVAVLNSTTSVRVGESVARDLREAIFVKIQAFSWGNLDRFSTGKLMVRLTSDASAVQRLTQVSLRIGTRAPLTMIGSIVLMFVTSPLLATTMVPILVIAFALIVFFSVKMEPLFRLVQQNLDRLNTVLQENIAGARLVKAFVRADREAERFEVANDEMTERTVKVMQFMSSMTPALTVFINLGMVLVIWLGGVQSIKGNLSLGQIVAFTNYLLATMNPLIMMTQLSNTWANGFASTKRINEVLEAAPEIVPADHPRSLPAHVAGEVSFDGVDFHFNGDSDLAVLENICFRALPGQTIAILGATGSGKSTLANLIPRFYDASRGVVRIDGLDVRDIDENSLLEHIGIVPQETVLFSGSVRDNIKYGRPDASDEEVIAAARVAEAHDFILRLPAGYDTRVEERGGNVSGGQKQRIAIARAIIMRPSILILDDSTSAVDVETETRIQASLVGFLHGCTCLMVAQRISTVLNADKIVVIDEGRIVAEGTHLELLSASEIYREIYDSQLGGGFHE